jgi:hypothetical protein
VSSITNWTSEYDVLDKVATFQHRTSVFATNDVRLIAVASTPTVMKVSSPDSTIAIPLHGSLQAWVGNRQFKVESPGRGRACTGAPPCPHPNYH